MATRSSLQLISNSENKHTAAVAKAKDRIDTLSHGDAYTLYHALMKSFRKDESPSEPTVEDGTKVKKVQTVYHTLKTQEAQTLLLLGKKDKDHETFVKSLSHPELISVVAYAYRRFIKSTKELTFLKGDASLLTAVKDAPEDVRQEVAGAYKAAGRTQKDLAQFVETVFKLLDQDVATSKLAPVAELPFQYLRTVARNLYKETRVQLKKAEDEPTESETVTLEMAVAADADEDDEVISTVAKSEAATPRPSVKPKLKSVKA